MNRSPIAIGIDIGGTKMALALVSREGQILARHILPTEAAAGFERAVDRLARAIDGLLEDLVRTHSSRPAPDLAGIGIGCAGPVDPLSGRINNPFTLGGWDQCDIVSPLRERFRVPALLENDADAAALGEVRTGAGHGFDPVVLLTFGTGVGGGTIRQGQVVRGVRGEHPELGHVPVDPVGPPCYCGIAGCLESIASGTALAEAGRPHGLDSARAVFEAARQRNPAAVELVERARRAVATAAWTICHTLLPERLVLGGGIMETEYPPFAEAIERQLSAATQFTRSAVTVAPAALGNDAGLIGAAALAFDAHAGA